MDTQRNWLIGIGAVCVILFVWFIGTFNGLVAASNEVQNNWADLQSAYQRRIDLANTNLPVVVAGAQQELAIFKTLRDQAAALSVAFKTDAGGQPVMPEGVQAQQLQEQIAAFDKAWINAISYVADNPDIRSVELYSDFMVQLEGSENRVNVARRDYNGSVTGYRNRVMYFPGNLVAGFAGYDPNQFPYFQAAEGAQNAPRLIIPTPVP